MQPGRSKRFVWPLPLWPKEQVWLLRVSDHVFCTSGEAPTSGTQIASSKGPKLQGVAAMKGGKTLGSVLAPSV